MNTPEGVRELGMPTVIIMSASMTILKVYLALFFIGKSYVFKTAIHFQL